MAKQGKHGATPHDGRFGVAFDDEISSSGVIATIIGVGAAMLVAFVSMWFLWIYLKDARDKPEMAPTQRMMAEAKKMAVPSLSPRLQADPEGELVIMRREVAKRLNGYGWVDEGNKVVHIPVDQAMNLVLERGLATATQAIAVEATGEAAALAGADPANDNDSASGVTATPDDHAGSEPADGAHSS